MQEASAVDAEFTAIAQHLNVLCKARRAKYPARAASALRAPSVLPPSDRRTRVVRTYAAS